MAVLLGTASAQVTLDIGQFMGAAKQAEGAMVSLAGAGTATGGPSMFDRFTKGALGLGTALIAPMTLGLKAAMDLEQGIANVNAALGGVDGSTLDMLADQFNEIGINSQYSAVQVAAVAEELAKAGFAAPELAGVTQSVVDLAQATGTDLPTSVGAVSQAMAVWQEGIVDSTIALTDASRVADIYTVAANNSAASVSDIAIGMRSLGPVAASMGISFEQAAAGVALFTNYGLTGADAGISLARGIQNLSDPTTEAAAAMEALGIQAFDTQGQFIGLGPLFEQLNTSMAGMSDQQKIATLSLIFGAEAMDVMGLAVLTGADAYNDLTGQMEESGAAADQSAIRMDTLSAQFGTLVEGVNTFLGSLVSGLIPGLRIIVDALNGFIDVLSSIPAPIKTVIGAVAGLLAGFAAITRSIQGFRALNGLMNAFAGNSGAATVASRGLLAGVLRFVPALALISTGFLIWKANIFGVQDRLKAFVNGLQKFGRSFSESFRNLTADIKSFNIWGGENGVLAQGMATLPALFIAFGNALADVGGGVPILEDIGVAAIGFGESLVTLTSTFSSLVTDGIDPFTAGITALTSAFPALIPLVVATQDVVRGLVDAFQAMRAGDFQEMFQSLGIAAVAAFDALSNVIVPLIDWTLEVGVPTVVAAGWDIVAQILDFIGESILVPLTNITASLDGAEIVEGALDLAGAVTDFIIAHPIAAVAIPAAIITLAFTGVPGILFLGLTAAAIALVATGELPPEITIAAVHLTLIFADFAIELSALAAEVALEVVAQLGDYTLGGVMLALEITQFDIAMIGLPAAVAKAVIDEVGDYSLGGVTIGLEIASWIVRVVGLTAAVAKAVVDEIGDYSLAGATIGLEIASWAVRLSGLTAAVAKAVVDEIGDYSLAGVTIGLEVTAIVEAAIELAAGANVGLVVKQLMEAAIPGGDIVFDLIAKFSPDIQLSADIDIGALVEAAIKAALPAGGIIISGIKVTFDLFDTDSGEPIEWTPDTGETAPFFSTMVDGFGRVRDAANEARAAIGGVFGGGGGAGGRGALGGGGGAGALLGDLTAVQTALTGLTTLAATASAAMNAVIVAIANGMTTAQTVLMSSVSAMAAAMTAGMAIVRSAAAAGMNAVIVAVANGMATARAVTATGAASMAASMVAGMATFRAAVTSGMSAAVGAVRSGVAQMVAAAAAGRGAMAAAGLSMGAALGQGVAAGIQSQIGAVAAAAAALVSAAVGAARSAGQISSPSKVMRDEIGMNLALGVAQGIYDGLPAIYRAGSQMIPQVPVGQYANSAPYGGMTTTHTTIIHAPVNIEGNVTTEDAIIEHAATAISDTIVRRTQQRAVALGVQS